jgi:hypothetical protein
MTATDGRGLDEPAPLCALPRSTVPVPAGWCIGLVDLAAARRAATGVQRRTQRRPIDLASVVAGGGCIDPTRRDRAATIRALLEGIFDASRGWRGGHSLASNPAPYTTTPPRAVPVRSPNLRQRQARRRPATQPDNRSGGSRWSRERQPATTRWARMSVPSFSKRALVIAMTGLEATARAGHADRQPRPPARCRSGDVGPRSRYRERRSRRGPTGRCR